MNRLFTTCAALALSTCFSGPMLAQDTATTPSSPTQDQTVPQNDPSSTMSSPSSQMSAAQGQSAAADLTGQTIYSSKGKKIGTVSTMSTDTHGQQAASVTMGKYLGMGGQTVLIPVNSLQARDGGGYTTTLNSTELKALAKSGGMSTSPQ